MMKRLEIRDAELHADGTDPSDAEGS